MENFKRIFAATSRLVLVSFFLTTFSHHSFADPDNPSEMIVFDYQHGAAEQMAERISKAFDEQGDIGIRSELETHTETPEGMEFLRGLREEGAPEIIVEKTLHPNRETAVAWSNERLKKLGFNNIQIQAKYDKTLPDPMDINPSQPVKWLRWGFGAGVALAATFIAGPEISGEDYMLFLLPAAGAGVVSVLLEIQFANNWMNSRVWTPFFSKGGAVFGRLKNLSVNFAYGMLCYLGYLAGYSIATSTGMAPSTVEAPLQLSGAMWKAFIDGLIFTIAVGQYQTDIGMEDQQRATISGEKRFAKETTAVIINNSARVAGWVVNGPWSRIAMLSFGLIRTLPQMIQSNFWRPLQDKRLVKLLESDVPAKPKPEKAGFCQKYLFPVLRRLSDI